MVFSTLFYQNLTLQMRQRVSLLRPKVISLVFMPGSGVMAQIRGYGEGGKTRFGWMASSDLGRGWIRVIDWRVDPMATRLVGLTQRGEAVCLRVIRSGDVKIELAPISY